jgi:multidrug efflux system membrane fusion protein
VLKFLRGSGVVWACLALCGAAACNSAAGAGAATAGAAAGRGGGRGGRGGDAIVPVVLGKAVQKDVPVDITTIGNVEAFSTISVRSQITGSLTGVKFAEGAFVRAGDVLFTIDERPFKALLQQAQANYTRDEALLTQAGAQLARDVANADYLKQQADRQAQLAARNISSKDQVDQANAAARAGLAAVAADQAAIESAKAQIAAQQTMVDSAKLQLDYTVIRAPISGRTGNVMTKAGNLVAAGSQELVTLTQIEPVYVTFSMPSLHLAEIKRRKNAGEQLPVVATPQDADAKPVSGRLDFIDNAVDQATDTIKLKAVFDNADRALWPGQYARVSLRLTTLVNAVVVPSQAVQTGQDGQFVFVVKPDNTVEQRAVKTGATVDPDVVITSGLALGDVVVTEGQLRLENGTHVTAADPKTGEAAPGGRGGRGGRGGGRGGQGQPGSAPAGPGQGQPSKPGSGRSQ